MKHHFLFSAMLCCYSLLAYAQTENDELKLALDYFESGNYDRAKSEYEGLLEAGLTPWKKEILNYDIGTTLLAEGKWEEAMFRFESLVDENSLLPVLQQKLRINLALARVLQLDANLEVLKGNLDVSNDEYNTIFILFRQVLSDIDKAEAAACVLEVAEGAKACGVFADLQELYLDVKSRFNTFLEEYSTFRLTHTSIQEGVSSLLFSGKSLKNQLSVFGQYKLSGDLKDQYLEMYLEQANSWNSLWGKVDEGFKNGSKAIDIGKQKEAFEKAKQVYLESISLAEEGGVQGSIVKLEKSQALLESILKQFFSESSLRDNLKQLLITYGLALIQEPIQEVYLEQIFMIQNVLEKTLIQSFDSLSKADYEKAQKYLDSGIKALADFHEVKARIFVEVARFYVENIFQRLDFTPKIQASAVLEHVINKQEFILLLNHLRQQVEKGGEGFDDIDKLLPELQQSTVEAAGMFPEAVMTQQKTVFNSEETKKPRCQCHPWDEVIPLFNEGYIMAEQANQYLQKDVFKLVTIERFQRKAVDYWKEALAKMRATSTQSKQPSNQQNQSEPPPEDENQPQKEQLNQILRLVQEMEKDDHSKPLFKTATGGNKGDDRPW